ncbi:MAG: hypothetical protein WHT65_04775 [Pseudothermotoga sp.]
MVKRSAFVLVTVLAVTLLIVSCVGPNQGGTGNVSLSGAISDLTEVSQSEPTYGLTLLASEDTKELFQSMAELLGFFPSVTPLYRQEYSDPFSF